MPDFSRYLEIIADPSQPVRELMAGLPANSQYYGGFEFVDSVHCKPFPLVYFPVFITNTGYDPVDIARGGYIFAYGDYLDIKTGWRNEYFFTRFCGTGAPPPDQLYPGEMLVTLVEFETRNAKPGAYRIRIGDAVSNVFIL